MIFKRAVLAAAIFGLCAGGAFAQITMEGGADVTVVPLQMVTRDTAEYQDNVWFGAGIGSPYGGMRTRVNFSASHENQFGFRTDVWLMYTNNLTNLYPGSNPNALEVRLGDWGHVWWRPLDWLRVDVGRIFNITQTGYIHDHWLSDWTGGMFDGQNIFSAHSNLNIGVLASFAPPQVEGLSVYVFVPHFGMPFTTVYQDLPWLHSGLLTPGGHALNSGDNESNAHRAFRVFQRTWVTVGYLVNDNMHARLQFIGANPYGRYLTNIYEDGIPVGDLEPHDYRVLVSAPRFEAAFAYLTDQFVVDFGVRVWLPVSNWISDTWSEDIDNPGYLRMADTGTFWGGLGFAVGLAFLATDSLVVNFRTDMDMLRRWSGSGYRDFGSTTITNPMRMSFHLWPTYTFENDMRLTVSAGLNYVGRNSVDTGGSNPNDGSLYWDRSRRVRFGGGASLTMPLFANSSVSFGIAYSHGTADRHGGEARVITIPIRFFYHW
ncbi:MAG: hypothetical protein FWC64_04515 [Treponema sp.]|nr:hypothetical protein [Treponema sp.]